MNDLFRDVDRLLRGGFTRREDLQAGRIEVPVSTLVRAGFLLGGAYGVFMGLFAVLRPGRGGWEQFLATTVKVPALFLLTLLVTFPSLYVISALAGSRLRYGETLRLLLAAIGVNLALLASFGPVTAFFTLSTESYSFMVFLNVLFFAVGGFVGLGFLRRALAAVFDAPLPPPAPVAAGPEAPEPAVPRLAALVPGEAARVPPPLPAPPRPVPEADPARRVFAVWTVVYAVVGAQMGWILRPFVGTPGRPFEVFRERDSNFFRAVWETVRNLFS